MNSEKKYLEKSSQATQKMIQETEEQIEALKSLQSGLNAGLDKSPQQIKKIVEDLDKDLDNGEQKLRKLLDKDPKQRTTSYPVLGLESFKNLLNNKIHNNYSAIFNLKRLAEKINPGEMNSRQRQNLWMLLNIALKKDKNVSSQEYNNNSPNELKKKLMLYAKSRHNKFKIAFGMFYGLNFISLFVPLVLKKLYPQKSFFKYNLYLAILLSLFSVSTLFVSSYKLSSRFKSKVDQFTCGIEFIDDQGLENKSKPPV